MLVILIELIVGCFISFCVNIILFKKYLDMKNELKELKGE